MNSDRDVSDTFSGACHNGDMPRFFALISDGRRIRRQRGVFFRTRLTIEEISVAAGEFTDVPARPDVRKVTIPPCRMMMP
jgi:hypothetical protein